MKIRNVLPRLINGAGVLVAVLAIPTFALTFALPLYTDEIDWKLQAGRYFWDGLQAMTNWHSPRCGAMALPVALPLVPYRVVDFLLYSGVDNLLWIRAASVLIALATVTMIAVELRRVLSPPIAGRSVGLGVFAFATLGILPFMLVVSRPEQLLLVVIAFLGIRCASDPARSVPGPIKDWAIGAGVVFASGAALAGHPKAVFFLPVFLMAAARLPTRWGARIVAVGLTALTAVYAYQYWTARFICPTYPLLTSESFDRSLFFAIKSHRISRFAAEALSQNPVMPLFIHKIVQRPSSAGPYTGDWLPAGAHESPLRDAVSYALIAALALFILAGLIAYLVRLRDLFHAGPRRGAAWGLGALWFSFFALSLTEVARNDYEAALMVPLVALASLLSIWQARDMIGRDLARLSARLGLLTLFGFSIASQVLLLVNFTPYLPTWTAPGYIQNQKLSISAFGYLRLREQIVEAAAQCGIHPEKRSEHLVVDLLTYLPFRQSYEPLIWASSPNDDDLTDIRNNRGPGISSDGVIISCDHVPQTIAGSFVKTGSFCCHVPFPAPSNSAP